MDYCSYIAKGHPSNNNSTPVPEPTCGYKGYCDNGNPVALMQESRKQVEIKIMQGHHHHSHHSTQSPTATQV